MNPFLLISIDGLRADDVRDDRIRLPNIRRVIQGGASVHRLHTIFPSVTWAIHNSVLTGCRPAKTGILGNSVYSRSLGKRLSSFDPECALFDQDQRSPNLLDALASQGKSVGAVCWPLTQGAAAVRFNIPEFYSQSHFEEFSSPDLWQELRAAGFPVDHYGPWSASHSLNPLQDSLSCDIARHLLAKYRPDVLFLHFLLIDSLQHDHGVGSPEAVWAMEYVDNQLGRILADLEVAGNLDSTNILLFSDHGHATTTQAFYVDSWLAENSFGGQPGIGPFVAVSNGGACYLYNCGASPGEETRLLSALRDLPWVRAAWSRAEFADIGLPTADPSPRGYLPDLAVELKDTFFSMTGEGPGIVVGPCAMKSMHGYRPDLPSMDGFLAAAGPAFAKVELESASILDIAPTINQIYGLGLTSMEGHVPTGLLRGLP